MYRFDFRATRTPVRTTIKRTRISAQVLVALAVMTDWQAKSHVSPKFQGVLG